MTYDETRKIVGNQPRTALRDTVEALQLHQWSNTGEENRRLLAAQVVLAGESPAPLVLPNTILQGDCLSILPQLATASVGFILTDPPYIARYKARDGRTVSNDDNDTWLKPAFAEMYRVLAHDSFAISFYEEKTGVGDQWNGKPG